ncbi:MAG TPA: TolC family protein [Xanthobacteraceae bacterium]|nr:TolC family protein [Xanthobacteraceae bacterium]
MGQGAATNTKIDQRRIGQPIIGRLLRWCCVGGLLSLALGACADYQALPLDNRVHLKHKLSELAHAGVRLDRPLSVYDIAVLAVQNNPDLIATRTQRGVARAQVLEAGLLPNPSLSTSYLFLLNPSPAAGVAFDAISAAISQDIQKTITMKWRLRSAQADALQVDATILWEEWQLIGKARLAVFDLVQKEKLRKTLAAYRDLLQDRFERGRKALEQGNTTLATVAPDAAAISDARKDLFDLERDIDSQRHDLNAMLGLAPEVMVPLKTQLEVLPVDAKAVMRALTDLADRRPDLIALQLGYLSQDEKVRGAIVGQFPAMTFGPSYAQDTSNVKSFGPALTMDIPIFDRNQGNIAVESATRAQLHAEFAARLSEAHSEVLASLATQRLLMRQLDEERAELPVLKGFAKQAEDAMNAGNIDERAYVDLVSASYSKEKAVLGLEQQLLEQEVAVATLIGAGMPRASLPTEAALEEVGQ